MKIDEEFHAFQIMEDFNIDFSITKYFNKFVINIRENLQKENGYNKKVKSISQILTPRNEKN